MTSSATAAHGLLHSPPPPPSLGDRGVGVAATARTSRRPLPDSGARASPSGGPYHRVGAPPPQVFCTFDFETYTDNEWFACAVVVAEYPSGAVLDHHVCSRPVLAWSDFAAPQLAFWQKHATVKARLDSEGRANLHPRQWSAACYDLCVFLRRQHALYPRLRLLSDNPSLDVRLFDNLLAHFRLPLVSIRTNGTWARVQCTSSYTSGVLGLLGGDSQVTIDGLHRQLLGVGGGGGVSPSPSAAVVADDSSTAAATTRAAVAQRWSHSPLRAWSLAVAHVPIHDCASTLWSHFQTLDVVHCLRQRQQTLCSAHGLVVAPLSSSSSSPPADDEPL